jgi:DNA recombination protein RmuC
MGLLRVVSYGWQQQSLAQEARNIADQAATIYQRLGSFAEHFSKIGKGLMSAVTAYNNGIGSLEQNLLPALRKMKELKVSTGGKEIEAPTSVTDSIREFSAAELKNETLALAQENDDKNETRKLAS